MARQSELDELRNEIDELRTMRPLADAQQQLSDAMLPPDLMSRAACRGRCSAGARAPTPARAVEKTPAP